MTQKISGAMISHWNTDGCQEEFFEQLKKYVKVDVYDWCHELTTYESSPELRCDRPTNDELLSSNVDTVKRQTG